MKEEFNHQGKRKQQYDDSVLFAGMALIAVFGVLIVIALILILAIYI